MFFDPCGCPATPDLTKPSPRALAHILRDKTLWPPGFEFGFGKCATCALAIEAKTWPEEFPVPSPWYAARALGISDQESLRIFMDRRVAVKRGWFSTAGWDPANLTPEAIAADLEKLA
jgi:hypothetical protein